MRKFEAVIRLAGGRVHQLAVQQQQNLLCVCVYTWCCVCMCVWCCILSLSARTTVILVVVMGYVCVCAHMFASLCACVRVCVCVRIGDVL